MTIRLFFLASVSVVGLSACSPVASNGTPSAALPILVTNAQKTEVSHQAAVRGRLHLDPHGCLRIGDDVGAFVIWSYGSAIATTTDGRLQITDGASGKTTYVGDEIALSGSGGPDAPENATPAIPAACEGGEFWLAGELQG